MKTVMRPPKTPPACIHLDRDGVPIAMHDTVELYDGERRGVSYLLDCRMIAIYPRWCDADGQLRHFIAAHTVRKV